MTFSHLIMASIWTIFNKSKGFNNFTSENV
jgi:hypothetical protein